MPRFVTRKRKTQAHLAGSEPAFFRPSGVSCTVFYLDDRGAAAVCVIFQGVPIVLLGVSRAFANVDVFSTAHTLLLYKYLTPWTA